MIPEEFILLCTMRAVTICSEVIVVTGKHTQQETLEGARVTVFQPFYAGIPAGLKLCNLKAVISISHFEVSTMWPRTMQSNYQKEASATTPNISSPTCPESLILD